MPIPHKQNGAAAIDALALLTAEHDKMNALFRAFNILKNSSGSERRKGALVEEICHQLTVHALLEQEIFYPALRAATGDDELVDEAELDHAGAAELIGQLELMEPRASAFDATVTLLGAEVAHHIGQEEDDMFFAARDAGIDLGALGERLAARKAELERLCGPHHGHLNGAWPHPGARRPPPVPN